MYFYGHHKAGKFLPALVRNLRIIQRAILNHRSVDYLTIEAVRYAECSGFPDAGNR